MMEQSSILFWHRVASQNETRHFENLPVVVVNGSVAGIAEDHQLQVLWWRRATLSVRNGLKLTQEALFQLYL